MPAEPSGSTHTSIAVIVVGHNSAPWLRQCFLDLGRHANKRLHLIYVDNASQDDSVGLVRSLGNIHILVSKTNTGFGGGCNVGARAANRLGVDVLFFLNPDTRANVDVIKACAQSLVFNVSLGAVGPLQIEYGSAGSPRFNTWTRRAVRCSRMYPLEHRRVQPFGEQAFNRWRLRQRDPINVWYVNGAAFAIRTQVFQACGGFDTGYFLFFEEVDLCRKVRWLGYSIALLPDLVVEHAWGGHVSRVRLRAWTRSKYHFVVADPELGRLTRGVLVCRELLNDSSAALSRRGDLLSGLLVLASFVNSGSAVRRSLRRNRSFFQGTYHAIR